MRLAALFALSLVLGTTGKERARVSIDSLADGCRIEFSEEEISFDLCPLFRGHGHLSGVKIVEEETPPSATTTVLRWNFKGPLDRNESIADEDQCPPGTWICKTISHKYPSKNISLVTQVVPIAGELSTSSGVPEDTHVDIEASLQDPWGRHDALYVDLYGGFYRGTGQHALFDFRCNNTVSKPTSPSFYGTWSNTHMFRWDTRHACATGPGVYSDKPVEHEKEEDKPDETNPVPSFDGDKPKLSHYRHWALRFAWITAAAIVVGLVYAIHTDRVSVRMPSTNRLKRTARSFARWHPLAFVYRRFTFRVGEETLVRWAREDEDSAYIGLDSVDSPIDSQWKRGASIFAVDNEEGRFVGDDDESIPLHPSPRKGGAKRYV